MSLALRGTRLRSHWTLLGERSELRSRCGDIWSGARVPSTGARTTTPSPRTSPSSSTPPPTSCSSSCLPSSWSCTRTTPGTVATVSFWWKYIECAVFLFVLQEFTWSGSFWLLSGSAPPTFTPHWAYLARWAQIRGQFTCQVYNCLWLRQELRESLCPSVRHYSEKFSWALNLCLLAQILKLLSLISLSRN